MAPGCHASSLSPRAWIVDVDLTGLTAGTAARLSFDLLGFGDRTSTSVLDNVLLTNGQPTAAPVAVNDACTVAEGATLNVPTLGLLTNDLDPDTSAFSLTAGAPSGGARIDPASGLFTWAVPRTQTVGRYTIALNVTDAGTPALSASRSVTVEVQELTNTPPTLNPIGPKVVSEESELRFTIAAKADEPIDNNILVLTAEKSLC